MKQHLLNIAMAALVAGCMGPQTPVPVSGRTEILAGEWTGGFESPATGRAGSIVFKLKAGTDSAWGDVVMVYTKATPWAIQPEPRQGVTPLPESQAIAIAFVACGDREVVGRLAPYRDPETGEQVHTTFVGELKAVGEFRGTYTVYYATSARQVTGEWSVHRKKVAE